MNLGPPELLIILGIIVLLFGARKLPELSRSLGESIQEFRRASDSGASSSEEETPRDDVGREDQVN